MGAGIDDERRPTAQYRRHDLAAADVGGHDEYQGLGSGVVFDTRGYIVTNNHVVAGSTGFQVLLANGKEYAAPSANTPAERPERPMESIR